jgi:hypothetical protein
MGGLTAKLRLHAKGQFRGYHPISLAKARHPRVAGMGGKPLELFVKLDG